MTVRARGLPRRRPRGIRWGRLALAGGALALAVVAVVSLLGGGGGGLPALPPPSPAAPARPGDPFGYDPARAASYVARATSGNAYVLFAKSPGGAVATAARVAAYRPLIDSVASGSGIDPGVLEALVFVESAGRPDVIAGGDVADAAGLTQILAQTGQSLLGMHIDLAASRRLTRQLAVAAAQGRIGAAIGLARRRAQIDDRFDPRLELAATVRYLRLAESHFGRADLAVESYHMGIGNLQNVLAAYGATSIPYVQLYFDSAPDRHAAAYRLLSGFGDDSSLYYWRVLGALQIMRMSRSDPRALRRLAALETASDSTAEVLHPPDRTPSFADPSALARAYTSGAVVPLPSNPAALGLAYGPGMGADARFVKAPVALYRGLRPVALKLLIALAARVRALSGVRAPLIVASTVTDRRYQEQLGVPDPEATTGYAFQIERRYAGGAQAAAFQSMLDRLQALNVIAWSRSPDTIAITVASDAARVIASGP
jgi:hypothetical protein